MTPPKLLQAGSAGRVSAHRCPVKARNTLDVNYLYIAEQKTKLAEVRPLHFVTNIAPEGTGYRVHFNRIDNDSHQLVSDSETADRVILAAGSLGSTEILFRARDQYKTLPNISRFLGQHWSSNGDFLTPAIYILENIFPTVEGSVRAYIQRAHVDLGRVVDWQRVDERPRPDRRSP